MPPWVLIGAVAILLRVTGILMSGFGTPFAEFDHSAFRPLDELVKRSDIPVLAICGSHQLLAHLYSFDIGLTKKLRDEPMLFHQRRPRGLNRPSDSANENGNTFPPALRPRGGVSNLAG